MMWKLLPNLVNKNYKPNVRTIMVDVPAIPWREGLIKDYEYDLAIIGGGIIGVSAARELALRHPTLKMAVIEKESRLGKHQTAHNAGMIHAEYHPNSAHARLCVEGMKLTYKYLDKKSIPYNKCGKLIAATNTEEVNRMFKVYERLRAIDVPDVKLVDENDIKEIAPHCTATKGIWSPQNGIVNWEVVTQHLAQDFQDCGGSIFLNFEVSDFTETAEDAAEYPVTLRSAKAADTTIRTRYVLTCAGLHADQLADLTGCTYPPRIVPFRAQYMSLSSNKCPLVNCIIYPVPIPNFPSLGSHITPRIDGSVLLGPQVVLAFRREGYSWANLSIGELVNTVTYPGFLRLSGKYLSFGLSQMYKSTNKASQMSALQKLMPKILKSDVGPGMNGVRAQAVDMEGNLVDDFIYDSCNGNVPVSKRILHCRNIPAPGATASLAIAKNIADKVEAEFDIQTDIERRRSVV